MTDEETKEVVFDEIEVTLTYDRLSGLELVEDTFSLDYFLTTDGYHPFGELEEELDKYELKVELVRKEK